MTVLQQWWHLDQPYVDEHFAFVRSLVSFDADSGTTVTDLIPGTTRTVDGSTSIITPFGRFGNGWSTATGNGLSVGVDLTGVPSLDYTVEFFVRFSSYGAFGRFFGISAISGGHMLSFAVPGGSFKRLNTGATEIATTGSVLTDQWYHVALVYVNGTSRHYIFLDGVQIQSQVGQIGGIGNGIFQFDLGCTKAIGGNTTINTADEFRFTHGVARYTSAFTPPGRAFPRRGP